MEVPHCFCFPFHHISTLGKGLCSLALLSENTAENISPAETAAHGEQISIKSFLFKVRFTCRNHCCPKWGMFSSYRIGIWPSTVQHLAYQFFTVWAARAFKCWESWKPFWNTLLYLWGRTEEKGARKGRGRILGAGLLNRGNGPHMHYYHYHYYYYYCHYCYLSKSDTVNFGGKLGKR